MIPPNTPVLDSYPQHKQLLFTLARESLKHPLNLYIAQIAIFHLIEVIGDDDLQFEIEEVFPHLNEH